MRLILDTFVGKGVDQRPKSLGGVYKRNVGRCNDPVRSPMKPSCGISIPRRNCGVTALALGFLTGGKYWYRLVDTQGATIGLLVPGLPPICAPSLQHAVGRAYEPKLGTRSTHSLVLTV